MTFVFEVANDIDVQKLIALLKENAEYRPDYFGSLATPIIRQWERQRKAAMAQLPPYREECSQ